MSRKSKRNAPRESIPPAAPAAAAPVAGNARRALFIGVAVALVLAFALGALVYRSAARDEAQQKASRHAALLASEHAPGLGKPQARVHIVEFLDPACETCAAFYPEVKKILAASPDQVRLSVRHVPFHEGSEAVVRMLEAARSQDKYWPALEALLASQDRWTQHHRVYAERAWPVLEGVGVDVRRLRAEMDSPAIGERIRRDLADAQALGVTKTPEFFVNGRPMPRFGLRELQELVRQALRESGA